MNVKTENENYVAPDERHLLLDHDYDGIQELDHPLPRWWLATFIGGIIFGVPYAMYYIVAGGPTLYEEFKEDMAKINEVRQEQLKQSQGFSQEKFKAIVSSGGVERGAQVFNENCMACHADGGKGDIGPNLTDNYWIHGNGSPKTTYPIIFNGVEENGMPAWSEMISEDDIYSVLSYLMTIKGTNVQGGKEPQGELVKE